MRIGILTGGGDVPGLNACMRTFTLRALEDGHEVVGIRRGWDGLVQVRPGDRESESTHLMRLGRNEVRAIDRTGGTFLHTSRTNPTQIRRKHLPDHYPEALRAGDENEKIDATQQVLETIEKLGMNHLVAIGGDDTLSVAVRLDQEGVPILAIPKTMDNDVHGTDYCIGFSTAVTRSVNFINDLRSPVGSHERIAVVELFGRYSGETALVSGYLASADRTLIAEVPFDIDRIIELLVRDKASNPSLYSVVVISEGARPTGGEMVIGGDADAFGHRKLGGIGDYLGAEIKARTGHDVMVQRLAYLMRSGPPDSLDRIVANNFGSLAYECVEQKKSGLLMAIQGGCYTTVPVSSVTSGRRSVDVDELYDVRSYRPKVLHVHGKPMFLY
ncbi:MAG: ATP-dependent 6-phosphofructokinase [Candidatus Eisenbacteria bacterium]|uniref:ATP-dependent 6-phosphofructokinase n=1 Tax=Eiseniibacteriota bacterium TaxID=2212470 RepID=A0A956LWY6_UNCEI|nr:ATP-dependent 6-phosphofructokinase [Candidatus Eisenbacteria bacterium]